MPVDAQSLTRLVAAAERRTAAEIVVVLAARADRWLGPRLALGMTFGGVTLAALCWGPWWVVSDLSLPGWTAVATGLGVGLGRWLVPLLPEPIRRRRVKTAAQAAFVTEGAHATAARVGLLVYVSALEDLVEIVPDVGIAALLPAQVLTGMRLRPESVEADLATLVDQLALLLPVQAGDQNLLADAPRVHR